jgi:hypothetical protein
MKYGKYWMCASTSVSVVCLRAAGNGIRGGDVFEIYLDYANRGRQTWWLVKRREEKNGKS